MFSRDWSTREKVAYCITMSGALCCIIIGLWALTLPVIH